ncbi:MAG: 50S ribosomal protein L6 [Candidatus Nealsonbacteria bacterium]
MSRIGKKIIEIPSGVELKIDGQLVLVSGPKGELKREFRPEIKIEVKDNAVSVSPLEETKLAKSLWGTTRVLIFNMIKGVTEGFEKQLEIQGIGFKAEVSGEELVLSLGFSHLVKIKIKEGINVLVEKNIIKVSGIDKELVGQFAANIRKEKKPEPYKGKGIRYLGEHVRRKVGKKVAGTTG